MDFGLAVNESQAALQSQTNQSTARHDPQLTQATAPPTPIAVCPTILRLGPVLMLVALLQICGGHWLALQSLAWTEMLVAYSHDAQLAEAVAKTFDGQHPCALCQTIEQGKKSERHAPAEIAKVKPVFVLPVSSALVRDAEVPWEQALPQPDGELLFEQPAVPPPRRATV